MYICTSSEGLQSGTDRGKNRNTSWQTIPTSETIHRGDRATANVAPARINITNNLARVQGTRWRARPRVYAHTYNETCIWTREGAIITRTSRAGLVIATWTATWSNRGSVTSPGSYVAPLFTSLASIERLRFYPWSVCFTFVRSFVHSFLSTTPVPKTKRWSIDPRLIACRNHFVASTREQYTGTVDLLHCWLLDAMA